MPIEMMIPIEINNENGTNCHSETKIILPIETFRKKIFLRNAEELPKEMMIPIVTLWTIYA